MIRPTTAFPDPKVNFFSLLGLSELRRPWRTKPRPWRTVKFPKTPTSVSVFFFVIHLLKSSKVTGFWLLIWESLKKSEFLFFFFLCGGIIQIALVPNQSLQDNLTPARVAPIKKFVLLHLKALTQVLFPSLIS